MKTPNQKTPVAISIAKAYRTLQANERKREQLRLQREAIEKQEKDHKYPDLKTVLFSPIALAVMEEKPSFKRFDVLGPFGICCEYAIHFYRSAKPRKGRDESVKGLNFVIMDKKGKDVLFLRDHSKNTKSYAENTLGAVNGMNAESVLVPEDVTGKWLLKFLS